MKPIDQPSASGKPGGKKVFDVMRPGKAPASSTSKPVIINTGPAVQDTQMKAAKTPSSSVGAIPELQEVAAELGAGAMPQPGTPVDTTPSDISPEDLAKGKFSDEPDPDVQEDAPAPSEPAPAEPAHRKISKEEELEDLGKAAMDASLVQEVDAVDVAGAFDSPDMVVLKNPRSKKSKVGEVLLILVMLILLVVIADVIVDVQAINTGPIPHTNFW